MNRKPIYTFLSVATLIVLLFSASCSKDYLEKPKGGTVTVDTIFHTKNQANMAIAQMYSTCIYSYMTYNNSNCGRPEVITDEVYLIHGVHDTWVGVNQNTNPYVTGNMSTETPCDWQPMDRQGDAYGAHYNGIRHANLVLENIDKVSDADQSWINDVKAQAVFCRAMQHYELFRYYGGIPIVNHSIVGSSTTVPSRSSVKSVVDSIVSWCDKAAAVLPDIRPAADYGKATKLAALALKARVLLYAASPLYNTPDNLKSKVAGARFGDGRDSVLCYPSYDKERWKLAADASKAVLDNAAAAGIELYKTGQAETQTTDGTYKTFGDTYASLGDYESVWNVYGNKEIIFLATYQQYPNSSFRWDQYVNNKSGAPATWGVKNNTPVEFMQLYEKKDGTKWTFGAKGKDLPDTIWNLKLDPRFYSTYSYDGMRFTTGKGQLKYYRASPDGSIPVGNLASSDAGVDGFAVETHKFCARVNNQDRAHFAWPVFRLAEFYLSYAEALNEYNGPSQEAYDAINLIRSRAAMPPKVGLDQAGFRTAIQNERTIELAFEGQRYNDLLRWLTATEVLNQDLHGIMTTAQKSGTATLRNWQQVFFIKRVFPSRYYYVPFKNAEISKNYLGARGWNGQNPGW